ncbi:MULTISPECIES: hypothetical protein [Enterobacterales]|uniref:hypothetical protein n=1 Tax=Enterobacterales TaxID=91347 RepID=UPI001CE3C97C|nr:hypothetical protein [Leclercia sp. Marseille-Q4284]
MSISIDLPGIDEQRMLLLQRGAEAGCTLLRANLNAPHYPVASGINAADYGDKHLRTLDEGWEPPAAALVSAWFAHFQKCFPEYASESKLAGLLGLSGANGGRRIRAYTSGDEKIPYGLWRRFLVMTGRASQEIIPVLGIFDMQD